MFPCHQSSYPSIQWFSQLAYMYLCFYFLAFYTHTSNCLCVELCLYTVSEQSCVAAHIQSPLQSQY